jgi:hypothetical protein
MLLTQGLFDESPSGVPAAMDATAGDKASRWRVLATISAQAYSAAEAATQATARCVTMARRHHWRAGPSRTPRTPPAARTPHGKVAKPHTGTVSSPQAGR